MPSPPDHLDRLVAAMTELDAAAQANIDRALEIQRRIRWMRKQLRSGMPLVQVVEREDEPRIVQLLSENTSTLNTVGAELRGAKALALREEGLTITEIGELFGVSRQRISALLRQHSSGRQGA